MNSRIKEVDDNVIHVNFTPEEGMSEDYIIEEEQKMFKDFTSYKNRNLIVQISIIGIVISLGVLILLMGLSSAILIFS